MSVICGSKTLSQGEVGHMSLNATPSANRTHVGFFGRRNTGKSSLANAITGQNVAIVSDVKGTTTDPVLKAMEILPLGPAVIIDTAGVDDEGELGALRVKRTLRVLNKTDVAVLVADATAGLTEYEVDLIRRFRDKGIPYVIAYNKADLLDAVPPTPPPASFGDSGIHGAQKVPGSPYVDDGPMQGIWVSAKTGLNVDALKEAIVRLARAGSPAACPIVSDLISAGDVVVLVMPIDEGSPKGRLILPQQQTIRELLEAGAIAVGVAESHLAHALSRLAEKPRLVITDSRVFSEVSPLVPEDIYLTSFSILFARHKGHLGQLARGAFALSRLSEGQTVLISEGCTHHRQCNDIGTVKLPEWIRAHTAKRTGGNLRFEFTSGGDFPEALSRYSLIVHCGGCMLTEREVKYRLACAKDQGVPITNYGMAIAHMNGILERSLAVFRERQVPV